MESSTSTREHTRRRSSVLTLAAACIPVVALTVAACGSAARPESHGGHHATSDSLPAGRLVFARYTDDSQDTGVLVTSKVDGDAQRQLTNPVHGVLDEQPDWSPDGSHVLFSHVTATGTDHESHRIAEMSQNGTGMRFLTAGKPAHGDTIVGFDSDASFSPDGRMIAYQHASGSVQDDHIEHTDIWVMRADGSHPRNLTRSAAYSGDRGGPTWSPDGKHLVFSVQTPSTGAPADSRALFTMSSDGSAVHRLTPWKLGANGTAAWSPTMPLLVFRAVDDEESGIGNFFSIHADGTNLTQITHFTNKVVSHKVSFSPDGRWIAFGRLGTGNHNDIYVATVDGSTIHAVTRTPNEERSPDWAPSPTR
jgi:Tol biopolymer transport system component